MSAHNVNEFSLTIANSDTDTEYLSSKFSAGQLKVLLGSLVAMTIFTPSALTGTITMQVRSTEASGTPVTLQSPAGTDIEFAAGKAVPVHVGSFRDFRLHSSGSEGAERVFKVVCQVVTN